MENLDFYGLLEADQHDPEIQYQLGLCYLYGNGTDADADQAKLWLQRAAEQGHAQAVQMLAPSDADRMQGQLTEDNLPEWCARAEDGDAASQFAVAQYFLEHAPDCNQSDIQRYLREAAEQGHGEACLMLGKQLLETGNCTTAVFYLDRACECSIGEAAELLSYCYFHGKGVSADAEKAGQLLQRAADWGDAETKFQVALRFALGIDVPASQGKGMSYLAKAQQDGIENARERFEAEAEHCRQEHAAKIEQERQRTETLEKKRASEAARKSNALAEGKRILALAQFRNKLLCFPLIPVGLAFAFGVFLLARMCQARPVQAILISLCFAAGTVCLAFYRKKLARFDTKELEEHVSTLSTSRRFGERRNEYEKNG